MKEDLKIIIMSFIEKSDEEIELSTFIKKIQDLINFKLGEKKDLLDLTDKYNSIYSFIQNLISTGHIESKRIKGLPPQVKVKITKKGIQFLEIIRDFLLPDNKTIIKNKRISDQKGEERVKKMDFGEFEEIGGEIFDIISEFDIDDQIKEKLIEKTQKCVVAKIKEKFRSYE